MSNRILSYRNLIADGGQDTILLSTKKGEVGYRIVKFQLMAKDPGETEYEHVVKIYKTTQSTSDAEIDFSDNRLLGAAYLEGNRGEHYSDQQTVIFDQEMFNQDVYITHQDIKAAPGVSCNYYLELEVIKLDESQAMVTTLKDIRNND